jgi:eukaryotic-like serine/threonine-protein kinase
MIRLGLDDDSPHVEMYAVNFLQHDSRAMAREVAWFDGKSAYEHEILAQQADSAAYMGQLASARALTARAVEAALRIENREQAAGWLLNSAWREEVFGNEVAAREQAARALAMVPNSRENAAVAAIILARTGEVSKAAEIERDLNTRYPRNVSVQRYWLPCIRAQIALATHRFAAALQELEVSRPYDALYPQVTNSSHAFSVVLRAEAYRGLDRVSAARGEWEYIVRHPGPISLSATAPLARLQIARSEALAASDDMNGRQEGGSAAKGRAQMAYKRFMSLWRDADPDIPILRQARSEYEALRRAQSGGGA